MPSGPFGPPIPGAPWTQRPSTRRAGGQLSSPQAIPAPQSFAGQLIPRIPPALMGTMGRAAHSVNMGVDMLNDMIRAGRLVKTADGWDIAITSADITDALGFVPSPDTAHSISTISLDASGLTLVTTSSNHGLSMGNLITITGNSQVAYNANWEVYSAPSATTFILGNPTTHAGVGWAGNGTGGAWSLT